MNIPATKPGPELDLDLLEKLPLIDTDGQNVDSPWHRAAIGLLIESVLFYFRARTDFFVGGNMFIYFNLEQARNLDYRGPDFFFVKNTTLYPERRFWAVWLEGGRYPDVIIELLSPTTAQEDRTTKKDLYEQRFRTYEYFLFDPDTKKLEGWRLGKAHRYQPIEPNEQGWLWSEELELWLGIWEGEYLRTHSTWLRFFDSKGNLVLNKEEAASHQVEELKEELARLKALMAQQGISEPPK
ncbi:MAG TPA: Uma2 family endonuclease [Gemmataceae bacterium]|nr:Uma2 family endonuclease [Gemmataceae bacterium]